VLTLAFRQYLLSSTQLGTATLHVEPVLTRRYQLATTQALCQAAGRGCVRTGARLLAWELAWMINDQARNGLPHGDIEFSADAFGCDCDRDHALDIAACNEFVTCAVRGDYPAALNTFTALEREADDADDRDAEAVSHCAFILARMTDVLAKHVESQQRDPGH
jgi:hypothetical protein